MMIFDIQHFSIHNGPGIRTTVFMKGCPLKCAWCHNPESLSSDYDRVFRKSRCISCKACLKICPQLKNNTLPLDESCQSCQLCMDNCPTNALERFGKHYTQSELVAEIMKDNLFYRESGGGVTFSGGEPLLHSKQLLPIFEALKDEGIHIAVDTSGYGRWESIRHLLPTTDLFLYDIKHMDEEIHSRGTGVSNRVIIENYKMLHKSGARLWVRIPMIPGFNMSFDFIEKVTKLLSLYPPEQINLLPYHGTAANKYILLGMDAPAYVKDRDYSSSITAFQKRLKDHKLNCEIGG